MDGFDEYMRDEPQEKVTHNDPRDVEEYDITVDDKLTGDD